MEPTIFELRLKFKPRLKFFRFGLRQSWIPELYNIIFQGSCVYHVCCQQLPHEHRIQRALRLHRGKHSYTFFWKYEKEENKKTFLKLQTCKVYFRNKLCINLETVKNKFYRYTRMFSYLFACCLFKEFFYTHLGFPTQVDIRYYLRAIASTVNS